MKKLFKNSFFSFLKNKLVIILISSIVFLTTATFTMFNSTANAFHESYDNVVQNGNLHDFTIKEKYSTSGSAIQGDPKEGQAEDLYSSKFNFDDPSYVNVDGKNILFEQFSNTNSTYGYGSKFLFAIDADEFAETSPTLDVFVIYHPTTDSFSTEAELDKNEIKDALSGNSAQNKFKTITLSSNEVEIEAEDQYGNLHKKRSTLKLSLNQIINKFTQLKGNAKIEIDDNYTRFSMQLDDTSGDKFKEVANGIAAPVFLVKTSLIHRDGNGLIDWDVTKKYAIRDELYTSFTETEFNEMITEYMQKINSVVLSAQHTKTLEYLNQFVDKEQIFLKDVKSLYVTDKNNGYKFVNNENSNTKVDKLNLFSGFGLHEKKLEDKMLADLKEKVGDGIIEKNIVNKGYRMVYNDNSGLVPKAYMVNDPTALAAVVSPSYATKNKKVAVSQNEFMNIWGHIKDDYEKDNFINMQKTLSGYDQNVIWVENTPYIITGVGVSPDFAYPIIDASAPIPDTDRQAILFTNDNGYKRIKDAFRGNSEENYIAVGLRDKAPETLFQEINNHLKTLMNWPSNMEPARMVDDLNEKYILAPQRISFLQKIETTVSTISWVTIVMLIIFTASIVTLVIRKEISNRRQQLGILMANGYTRSQIGASMMTIGLIVAVVSSISGYLFGHFMQFAFIGIFDNYWTLPIWETQFSWVSLVITVLIPLAGVSLLVFVLVLWELRGNLIEILNGSSSTSKGRLSSAIMFPFKWARIKTKLSISIFSSNLSKMFIALLSFSIAIASASITFNTFGKFDYALNQSEALTNYEYQIDLTTPTRESGVYGIIHIDDLANEQVMNPNGFGLMEGIESGEHQDHPFYHVPVKNDQTVTSIDGQYLLNRIQTKSLLSPFMGAIGIGAIPWDIATKSMPENQKNIADKKFQLFIEDAIEKSKEIHNQHPELASYVNADWFPKTGSTIDYKHLTDMDTATQTPTIKPEYIIFLSEAIKRNVERYKYDRTTPLPFMISYGNNIFDGDDEIYSHVDLENIYTNSKGIKITEDLKIRGIIPESKFVNLKTSSQLALNTEQQDGTIPVVVNKYFAKTHLVSVGSTFESEVNNYAERNIKPTIVKPIFKVVAIENSFDDGRVFTSKKNADKLLGWNPEDNFYNGIYSKHKDEALFNNLSLYSPSGLYIASDTLSDQADEPTNKAALNYISSNFKDMIGSDEEKLNLFINKYSKSPILLAYSTVDWATASAYQFHSILHLSSSLMWLIQGITLFIAFLFVTLISSMIISDNKKFIATLKVIGYRSKGISNVFLRTFIPAFLGAIIIATPVCFSIVLAIQSIFIDFGHVLIPFEFGWWEIIAASAVLIFGFIIMYHLSSRELKNTLLINAFKQ